MDNHSIQDIRSFSGVLLGFTELDFFTWQDIVIFPENFDIKTKRPLQSSNESTATIHVLELSTGPIRVANSLGWDEKRNI